MSTTEFSILWARHYKLGWEDAFRNRGSRLEKELPHPDFMEAYLAGREDLETSLGRA